MVARYGAGLCVHLEPDDNEGRLCHAEVSRRDLWCDDHVVKDHVAGDVSRAAALRDMRRVLDAAASALGF